MECSRRWSNLCSVSTSYLLTRPSSTATPKDTLDSECNATTNSWGQPFSRDTNTHLTRIHLPGPLPFLRLQMQVGVAVGSVLTAGITGRNAHEEWRRRREELEDNRLLLQTHPRLFGQFLHELQRCRSELHTSRGRKRNVRFSEPSRALDTLLTMPLKNPQFLCRPRP
jgi:hypothetical protein